MDTFSENSLQFAGIKLTANQLKQFETLAHELLETNKTTNLTAIRDADGVYLKHFLDSLTLLKALPSDTKTLADIGSGAGFPGLPIAIACPNIHVTMIESIGKKINFIKHTIEILGLKNTSVVHARAESLREDKHFKEKFDVVTARAVTALPTLLELCIPLVKPDGTFIAMKNSHASELDDSQATLKKLNIFIEDIHPVLLPNLPARELICIHKNCK